MLLRSVTKHVKDQNWFAVFLDFFIVVAGILIAFQITNWNEGRQSKADLVKAEAALKRDLLNTYLFAKERLALKNCRIASLTDLSNRLLEPGDLWEGIPGRQDDRAIAQVYRTPGRPWGSRIWQTELARGTFNEMDTDRREKLDSVFHTSARVHELQINIKQTSAKLKTLSKTIELSRPERLRYHEMVGEIDENSAMLELLAGQIESILASIDIELNAEERAFNRKHLTDFNAGAEAIYGKCYDPIVIPLYPEPERKTAK